MSLIILTCLYRERDHLRRQELLFALRYNLTRMATWTQLDRLLVYYDQTISPVWGSKKEEEDQFRSEIEKLLSSSPFPAELVPISGFLSWDSIFSTCRQLPSDFFLVMNGDILLFQHFEDMWRRLSPTEFVALTRYDLVKPTSQLKQAVETGSLEEIDQLLSEQESHLIHHQIPGISGCSQDVWIFSQQFLQQHHLSMGPLALGMNGCDTILNDHLSQLTDYRPINPSRTVKAIHMEKILTDRKLINNSQMRTKFRQYRIICLPPVHLDSPYQPPVEGKKRGRKTTPPRKESFAQLPPQKKPVPPKPVPPKPVPPKPVPPKPVPPKRLVPPKPVPPKRLVPPKKLALQKPVHPKKPVPQKDDCLPKTHPSQSSCYLVMGHDLPSSNDDKDLGRVLDRAD